MTLQEHTQIVIEAIGEFIISQLESKGEVNVAEVYEYLGIDTETIEAIGLRKMRLCLDENNEITMCIDEDTPTE